MLQGDVLKSARLHYERLKCNDCPQQLLKFIHVSGCRYRLECPSCKGYADLNLQWYDYDYHEYPEDFELSLVTNVPHFADDEIEIEEILCLFARLK